MSKYHVAGGYFLFPRIFSEGKIWQNRDAFRLYMYYLKRARYANEPAILGEWAINRGELLTSLQQISDETSWIENKQKKCYSRDKILVLNRFLSKNRFITVTANRNGTKISICNYNDLQNVETYTSNTNTTETSNTGTTHNNKVNKNNTNNSNKNSPNSFKSGQDGLEKSSECDTVLNINDHSDNLSKDCTSDNVDIDIQLPAYNNQLRQNSEITSKITSAEQIASRSEKFNSKSDEIRLSKLLFTYIKQRDDKAREPDFQKWAHHVDRLRRLDDRAVEQIEEIIKWCQEDSFWQSVILSTASLRKNYNKLLHKMEGVKNGKSSNKFRLFKPRDIKREYGFDKTLNVSN